jgi:RNA polymerase sigma factor (sigma-70 family)
VPDRLDRHLRVLSPFLIAVNIEGLISVTIPGWINNHRKSNVISMNRRKGEPVAVGSAMMPLVETGEDLSQLFRGHYRRVLLAAYRITGSMADAEDVAQAVFLRMAGGNGAPVTNAGSYLYRSAINGALDLLRHRKAAPASPLEDAAEIASSARGSSPDAEVSSRELGNLLRVAISELPPRAAEMFTLRYVEELGNREIAVLMGTSQAVVAVTLFNARSRLKKRLMELDGERR